jgi:hypothetical protein
VDKLFKYKLLLPNTLQFRHCLKFIVGDNPPLCEVLSKNTQQRNSSKSKSEMSFKNVKTCKIHGAPDMSTSNINNILNLSSERRFISMICFLAQLYFKILNIEDRPESYKETRRKFVCNLIFSILSHCKPINYYYPMRALTELYLEKESEKTLRKRLNAKDYLTYK